MEPRTSAKFALNNPEWHSKLTDGVLAAAVLILIWMTVALAIRPISMAFGPPGLLVYDLGLLAVAMFALQQALVPGRIDAVRAWYGITSGLLAWAVVEVTGYLGVPVMPGMAVVILLIMAGLIVWLMWKTVLPAGARFFSLTLLLNWAEHLLMETEETLAVFSPVFHLVCRATGFLAILLAVLALGWILFQSRRRIQRISAALAIWFLFSLALYVFRGSLF
jgi:hypothetical protein